MPSKADIGLAIADDIVLALIIGIVLALLVFWGVLSPVVAFSIGALAVVLFAFVAYKTAKALLMKPMAGESMIGKKGVTVVGLNPEGMALIGGEYWRAISSEPIEEGVPVEVVKAQGTKVTVVRAAEEEKA